MRVMSILAPLCLGVGALSAQEAAISHDYIINVSLVGEAVIKSFHNIKENVANTFVLPLQSLGNSMQGKVYSMSVTLEN